MSDDFKDGVRDLTICFTALFLLLLEKGVVDKDEFNKVFDGLKEVFDDDEFRKVFMENMEKTGVGKG